MLNCCRGEFMIALSFSQVNKRFDQQVLFENMSFSINQGDSVALIGKNGCGKTTAIRLICGLENADSGEVHHAKNLTIGHMKQTELRDDVSLINYALAAFDDLIKLEATLAEMEQKMGQFTEHDAAFEAFMAEYDHMVKQFETRGGYLFRSKAKGILIGMGFAESEHNRSILSLSGGQLARIKLARLLIDAPDILLLDEPTNHLDITTTTWLENYLKQYPKTLVIISHDRYFLDAVCNKTMEIENRKVMLYSGNYSAFKIKKQAQIEQMARAYQKYQTEKKRQEEIIRRFKQRGTELLAKRAKSREKMLEKMTQPDQFKQSTKTMKLNLKASHSSGSDVLQVEGICKSYDETAVLNDISFSIRKGEKIGLIGDNGSGKSTLLKIIVGNLAADSGEVNFGHRVSPAYYDQNQDNLDYGLTIVEEIHNMIPTATEGDVRAILGRFLFSNDDAFKPINVLSGGEKARVMLTKLLLTDANLLLLDEPTNHLDIYSKEVLEQALIDYDGTMLIISHDRYFLNKTCQKIIELKDGKAFLYLGNYDYYIEKKAALNKPVAAPEQATTKTAIKQNKKLERQRKAEIKALKKQFNDCETAIFEIEMRLGEIGDALCLVENYSNQQKAKALTKEESALKAELDEKIKLWEDLAEQIDNSEM